MACFVLDNVSGKNLSWRSTLWGSPSHVCLPLAGNSNHAPSHARRKPLMLLSEGIGITPMIAMARFLMEQVHRQVDVHFIHEIRGDKEAPFLPDIYAWNLSPYFTLHLRQPLAHRPLRPAMSHGMVDSDFLTALHLPADAEYYICGSLVFTDRNREALQELGVAASQIHVASIGPAPAAPAFGSPFLKKLDDDQRARLAASGAKAETRAARRTGLFAFFFAPFGAVRRLGRI
jgi:ferredoxin-NADP reductase